ncbi:MAG: Ig-like domain-containing protein [Proteobacteria bacterium]|nr:Ig-like domain-containing protein [Pseudomonadota bacterium]
MDAGRISYRHDGGEMFSGSFQFTLSDGERVVGPRTFTFDVLPQNDTPTASGASLKVAEGGSIATGLGVGDGDNATPTDRTAGYAQDNTLTLEVVTLPDPLTGQLRLDGAPVAVGDLLSTADLARVTYQHLGAERYTDSFQVRPRDDRGVAAAGTPAGNPTNQPSLGGTITVNITVLPVNDPPVFAGKREGVLREGESITIQGATGYTGDLAGVTGSGTPSHPATGAFLSYSDSDNATDQRQYRVTTAPANGAVRLDGQVLGAGSVFTQADLDAGRITYVHDGSETTADFFDYVVSDGDWRANESTGFPQGAATTPSRFNFAISGTNDAPAVAGPSGPINIDSTVAANNPVAGFVVSDIDLTDGVGPTEVDFVQVTLRLLDSTGAPITNYATGFAGGGVSLAIAAGSGATVTRSGPDDIVQFQGSRAQVNAALAGLTVTFANDCDLVYRLQVIVDDRVRNGAGVLDASGSDANGGELNQGRPAGSAATAVPNTVFDWATAVAVPADHPNIIARTVDLRASHTNDPATFTAPGAATVDEDVRTRVSGSFAVSDPESDAFGTPVVVTLSVPAGNGGTLGVGAAAVSTSLAPAGGQAVTISGDNTRSITLTGRAMDIQALLNGRNLANTADDATGGLFYTTVLNVNHDLNGADAGDVTLAGTFSDSTSGIGGDVGAGSVANNPPDVATALTITAVNDAPVVSLPGAALVVAGTAALTVTGVSLTDVDANDGYATGETDGTVQVLVRLLAAGGAPLDATAYASAGTGLGVTMETTAVGHGATVDGVLNGSGAPVEVRGTLSQVQAWLAGLQVTFANLANSNVDQAYSIEAVADDRLRDLVTGALAANANGGATNQQAGLPAVPTTDTFDAYATTVSAYNVYNVVRATRSVFVSSINDPGSISANNVTVAEASATLVLNAGNANITIADPDDNGATNLTATVTLPVGSGLVFSAVGGSGGSVLGTGTAQLTLTGTEAQLNTRLQALTVAFPDPAGAARAVDWNGSFTVTVVYNDAGNTGTRPAGIPGDTNVPTANPGDFDYADGVSAALLTTRTFTVTVTAVNDAPLLPTFFAIPPTLLVVEEDAPGGVGSNPPGSTVLDLFGPAYTDTRDQVNQAVTGGSVADAFAGIAITGNAAIGAQGVWQYSTDGSNWTALPVVSETSALQLQPGDRLRFVPAADFHGDPGALTARLVDASGPALVTGSTVDVSGAFSGGSTRYSDSSNTVTHTVTVLPVNDRPTAESTALAATFEDNTNPTGAALAALGFGYGDAIDNRTSIAGGGNTATALGGYAIVGNASAAAEGRWQYSTGGGVWLDVAAVSDASAVVLPTTASLRFLPAADYNGTPGALTLRLADSVQAVATGVNLSGSVGPTGTWSLPVGLATSVDPRNDAPVLSGTVNATFTEGSAPVALLSGGAASDIDLPGVVTFGGGRITVTLDTWRAGDVLSLAGSPAGVVGTTGGNGTSLVVNLNTAATPATIGAILNALRFENPSPHLLGVDDFDRVYTVVLNDGNNVNGAANAGGNGGGDPTLNSNVLTGSITLVQINDPGPISANNVTVAEASATLLLNAGNANIVIADPDDNGATNLTATVTLPAGSGLVFSAVGGSGGSVLGTGTAQLTLTGTEAQLNARLQALTVAFPDPAGDALAEDWNGSFTVTVVYNDAGNTGTRPVGGVPGDTNLATANPGDFDYADGASAALVTTRTFAVTVTAVNDAPRRLAGFATVNLAAALEDAPGGAGATVASLFGVAYTDAWDQVNQSVTAGSVADAFAGIAITTNTAISAQGVWQYSSDGSTWTNLPTVSATAALQLQPTDALRFVPAADYHGAPGSLVARLVDGSGAALVTGSTVNVSGALSGGITRYSDSSNAVTLGTTVSPVNDRPTATGTTLVATFEDNAAPPGATLSSLAFAYGDTIDNQTSIAGGGNTATSVGGYAIVGNASAAAEGRWQYSTGGGVWLDVAAVSDASAVVLPTTASLRFLPAADYNGTPGALTLRLADSVQAVATGVNLSGSVGPTGTWSLPVALATSVDPRNDAPVLSGTVNATFTEGSAPVALLSGGAASDIDLPGVVTFGGGRITVSLDTWRAGDVLSLAGSPAGVVGTSGGSGASLVVNLNTAATPATIGTILNALRFENTSNDPVGHLLGIDDFDRAYTVVLNDGNNVNGAANAGGNGGGDPTLNSNVLAGVITVVTVNDPPVATDDTSTLTEDTVSVSGNVKTGVGGTLDTDPDHLNAELFVSGIRAGAVEGAGAAGAVGGAALAGLYGTLSIAAGGSYTYTLDRAHPVVNALVNGQSLVESFNYTISDPVGAQDAAVLAITITGVTDGGPSISAVDGNGAAAGQATVYESGLTLDGPAGQSRTASGELAVSAPDGLATVGIGGTVFTVAQLASYSVLSPSAAIVTAAGSLRVTGFVVVSGADAAPASARVLFSYTLDAAQLQPGATESLDTLALQVTDASSAAASGVGALGVAIVDDLPEARADTAAVVAGTTAAALQTAGNVVVAGAAGDASDRIGADTVAAPVTALSAGGLAGTPGTALSGRYGQLQMAASGAYVYRADATNPAVAVLGPGRTLVDVFDYTITDADGDTSTTTLSITLRGDAVPLPASGADRPVEGERRDPFRPFDMRRSVNAPMEPSLHVQNAVRETAAGTLEHGRLIQGLALPPGSEIHSESLSIPDSMDPTEHVSRDGVRYSRQLLADGQERPGSLGNVYVVGNQTLFDPFSPFGTREVVAAGAEAAVLAAQDAAPPVAERPPQPGEGTGAPAVAQDGTGAARAVPLAPWTGFTQQLRQVALERALVREGQSSPMLPRVVHAPAAAATAATEGARTLARAG